MYLYLLRNTVNGKGYVGITSQPLVTRIRDHISVANNGRETVIAKAIRKHGPEHFTVAVLRQTETWEEVTRLEREAIAHYGTVIPHGYNITHGGDGALGRLHTDEAKQRISLAKKGTVCPPQTREAVGNTHRGVPKSPETRAKMSAHQVGAGNHRFGKHPSAETREKMSAAKRGNTFASGYVASPELRAQRSLRQTGRHHTPEAKAAIGAGNRGVIRSPEFRAKVAESLRQMNAARRSAQYEAWTQPASEPMQEFCALLLLAALYDPAVVPLPAPTPAQQQPPLVPVAPVPYRAPTQLTLLL